MDLRITQPVPETTILRLLKEHGHGYESGGTPAERRKASSRRCAFMKRELDTWGSITVVGVGRLYYPGGWSSERAYAHVLGWTLKDFGSAVTRERMQSHFQIGEKDAEALAAAARFCGYEKYAHRVPSIPNSQGRVFIRAQLRYATPDVVREALDASAI